MNINPYYSLDIPKEAKQVLLKVACAYMDYYEYWLKLSDLEERYDETIEQYDPETWFAGLSIYHKDGEDSPSSTMDEANSLLREATDTFYSLVSSTKKSCCNILRYILAKPPAFTEKTLGFEVAIPPDNLDAFLLFFFDYLEDEGMYFEPSELYSDPNVKVVDIFQSITVKANRFLSVLEEVKRMDIPNPDAPAKHSSQLISPDFDIGESMSQAMERFIEMRKSQSYCVCSSCESEFYADNQDIECGMVMCPECGSDTVDVLHEE